MNPWRCKTQFLPYASKHSLPDLLGHMGRLCELDRYVKSGARSKRTKIELTVLAMVK
jgi:DNA polymerase III delta subunit